MNWLTRLVRRDPAPAPAPDRETLDGWLRTGYDQFVAGQAAEAQHSFQKILEHDPRDADALFFLGVIAVNDNRETEACELYRKAAEARPNDATFWFAMGCTLYSLRRFEEGMEAFRSGLALQPGNVDMRNNFWATLIETGRGEEVRESMELAGGVANGSRQVPMNLGSIYRDYGRIDEAIAAYRRALELVPSDNHAFGNLLLTMNYSANHDAAALFAEHLRFGARFATPYVAPQLDRSRPRRLRVGYVSPDFRFHVVSFFMEPILANHDRERFEIFCYYSHRQEDHVTARLRALADHWLDCVYLSNDELAARIREDRIDILVDLAGHTAETRLLAFASRPAPVQMAYLGYPNTTGLPAIDYRITDAMADPPGEADRLSVEQLVRLPTSYFCYRPPAYCPDVERLPALEAGRVTFGCFNNLAKLSVPFLDAAARVLAAVPDSRLLLKGKAQALPHVAERVRESLARMHVDPARVELRIWVASADSHLSVYGSVDIALDSFPYNGATTTCEALWMGVPVVTLVGDRHASRMGSSLLNAIGLAELVAADVDGYVEKCVALAGDLRRMSGYRDGLRARMRQSPLMDEAGFTRALERCYLEVWEKKTAPEPARDQPGEAEIGGMLMRAAGLRAAGKTDEAENAYKEMLLRVPDQVEALTGLWDIAYETGVPGAAVEWLRKGISVNSRVASLHYMMGCSLLTQDSRRDAIACFHNALTVDPGYAKARNNLGCAFEAEGKLKEAWECYRAAIELDPKLADAHYNLGNVHRQLGDSKQAIEHIRQALALEPGRADWNCNLADALLDRLQLDESVLAYRNALAVDARYERAHAGLGLALLALGFTDEAGRHLREATQLKPEFAEAHSNWLLARHYLMAEDAEALFEGHVDWAKRHAQGFGLQAARAAHELHPDRRINIGYVSPDFQRHPVVSFIEPLLGAHDRSKFKVFCYSSVFFPDEVTRRIQGQCEEWREISRSSDESVAERIRADRIDILVDLAGHTGGGRLRLFARKPAPIQVTWLGYPDTTGLREMDYRLTDAHADPVGETERFHTETLVRLESGFLCYRPPEDSPAVGESPSIKTGRVTFGSFNNLPKLTPPMIALWVRLLKASPDSRLVVKAYGLAAESARQALQARFAEHGMGADRVELLAPEPSLGGHLARYGEVDIALDTFPYNGVTTTCEALWMGVPVVTLAGKTHAARVGASILNRVGLAHLVAGNQEEYLAKALALAADAAGRQDLRSGLRQRLQASPLLDGQGFARGLEAAYLDMWSRYADAGREPLRLHVGGKQCVAGWKILNVQPGAGVDFVGDCSDLSQFEDGVVDEIYASHVVEHLGYQEKLPRTLAEFQRVLTKDGTVRISVPDFEVLSRLFLDPRHSPSERIHIMRMVFGGQTDPHDFHYVGLSFEILSGFLARAGFSRVERVGDFGLFDDDSTTRFSGVPISLNVIARK